MLTSVYLVPHGMQVIPGLEEPYHEGFRPIHEALLQAGRDREADGPELLILLTPHGHTLPGSYLVYLHGRFQGLLYALTESNVFGELKSRALWTGDLPAAGQLLEAMRGAGLAAEGLVQGSPDYPLTLAWGEVVPLTYLAGSSAPRVVIISLPRRRSEGVAGMQAELAALGRVLLDYARAQAARVAIICSADLAHRHAASGPYGYHKSAAAFDRRALEWAQKPTREGLQGLLALDLTARACGLAGLCVLQEILEAEGLGCRSLTYAAPTYFGLLVSRWA